MFNACDWQLSGIYKDLCYNWENMTNLCINTVTGECRPILVNADVLHLANVGLFMLTQ